MSLLDEIVEHKKQVVKEEPRNSRLLLHAALSAYTATPLNVAIVAPSSEGKTFLTTNILDVFPSEDVQILKSVSPKTFTREQGNLAIPNPDATGQEDAWTTEIKNPFLNKKTGVDDYLEFLYNELQRKESEHDKDEIRQALG
jgi:hypothetical protein